MSGKNANLLAALKKSEPVNAPDLATMAGTVKKAAPAGASSREGKSPMTNWLPDAFPATLDLLKAQLRAQGRKTTREELIAEALNLLFQKYKVPTVGE